MFLIPETTNVKNKQRRTRQREQLIWLSHFACFFVSVFTSLCVCHVIIENQREQEQKNKSFHLDTFKSYLDVKKKKKKKEKKKPNNEIIALCVNVPSSLKGE